MVEFTIPYFFIAFSIITFIPAYLSAICQSQSVVAQYKLYTVVILRPREVGCVCPTIRQQQSACHDSGKNEGPQRKRRLWPNRSYSPFLLWCVWMPQVILSFVTGLLGGFVISSRSAVTYLYSDLTPLFLWYRGQTTDVGGGFSICVSYLIIF